MHSVETRHIVLPHPYTWGMCGTCNAAKNGIEKTTEFSAGLLYTPKRGKHN